LQSSAPKPLTLVVAPPRRLAQRDYQPKPADERRASQCLWAVNRQTASAAD
jgi:hypothetical protein